MATQHLNTSLSDEQARFALWLKEKMPYLMDLFDFDKREYTPEAVERYLGVASHGQAIMARFVLGVWRHDNYYNFDFVDAASTLDADHMKIITDWLNNPVWP